MSDSGFLLRWGTFPSTAKFDVVEDHGGHKLDQFKLLASALVSPSLWSFLPSATLSKHRCGWGKMQNSGASIVKTTTTKSKTSKQTNKKTQHG